MPCPWRRCSTSSQPYCETDRLSQTAWDLFGTMAPGWRGYRRSAITCTIASPSATRIRDPRGRRWRRSTSVAACVAITRISRSPCCRCLNIPARYCTGYISDIGLPLPHAPGDFAAWMEVFLGGRWHTFDPRNNSPRIGRILIAYGRDAADVPLTLTFGPNTLVDFHVTTEEAQPLTA